MKKIKKKIFSLLLAFMTAFSMLPMNVVNAAGIPDMRIYNFTIPKKITEDDIKYRSIGLLDLYHSSDPYYDPGTLSIDESLGISYRGYVRGTGIIPVEIGGYNYKVATEKDLNQSNINYYYILTIPTQSTSKSEITVLVNDVNFTGYKGSDGYYVVVDLGKSDSNNKLSGGVFPSDTWTYDVSDNVMTATCDAKCGKEETTTLTLKAENRDYDRTTYNATLDNEDDFTKKTGAKVNNIEYYVKGTSNPISNPTDAGEYTAKVSISDEDGKPAGTISKDFSITKADISPTISINDWTYGEYNADTNKPIINENLGDGDVTYLYKKSGEPDDSYEEISIDELGSLNAGDYLIKANVAETKNYNSGKTDGTTFTVGKAKFEGTVTFEDNKCTYDGKKHSLTAIIPNGAIINYKDENGGYTLNKCPEYTDVGEYALYYKVTLDNNHTEYEGVEWLYINPAEITISGITAKDKEYDGNNIAELDTSKAVINGVVPGESITVQGGEGTFTSTSAGTYTVNFDPNNLTLLGNENKNYTISGESQSSTTATITPRKAQLKWSKNTQFTYDANLHGIDVDVENKVNEDTLSVQYENNLEKAVGTYTAEVTSLGNDNYTLEGVDNVTQEWSISYLTVADDVVATTDTQPDGENGWYKNDVTINAPDGYKVSLDGETWSDSLLIESDCDGLGYYLKNNNDQITDKKTLGLKIDKTCPTGTITIKENKFTTLLNTITFGYFFKNNVDVTIDAEDVTSDIAKIEYQTVENNKPYNDDKWEKGNTLSLPANGKYVVYARITDKAGNVQIINSDGVVVYTDATSESNVTYTKTTTEDVITGIQVNENKIREIKDKNNQTLNWKSYIVNNKGFVVLKNDYVKDLDVGEYTYTISYYPLDVNYDNHKGNSEEPITSTVTLTVKHKDAELSVKEVETKNYLDKSFNLDVSYLGIGAVSYSSDDEEVATVSKNGVVTLHNAGKANITVSLADDGNYADASKTISITVNPINHNIQVENDVEKTYGDEPFNLNVKSDDQTSNLEYVSNNEEVATVSENGEVILHNAGKAIITVTQGKTRNYNETTKEVEVNVLPKKATVTAENKEKVYGSKDEELTYTSTGLVNKDQLSGITLSRVEGEVAGTYDITVSQEKGANPNYDLTFEKGTYTIKPFAAKNINVKLDNTLAFNGEKQEQLVKEVTLDDGTVIPSDGYTVEGNVATEPGTYTLTIKGKGNYTGEYKVTYVVVPTKETQLKEDENGNVEIGNGKLSIAADTKENNLNAKLETSKSDVLNMLVEKGQITADDLSKVANGAKLDIILKVQVSQEENTSKEARQNFETAIKDYKVGKLLNITLVKHITENGTTKEEQIHELQNKIKVSIEIPEELINKDAKIKRTYSIARNHNGKIEILEGIYDEKTHTYTFETDKFSDYAILYQDTKVETSTTTITSNGSNTKTTTKAESKKVKTGDDVFVAGYAILLLMALGAMIFLKNKIED